MKPSRSPILGRFTSRAIRLGFAVLFIAASNGAATAADTPPKPHDIVELEEAAVILDRKVRQVPAVLKARPLAPLEPAGKQIHHGVCINAERPDTFERALAKYVDLVGHRPSVLVQFAHAFDAEKALDWEYHAKVLRTIDQHGLIPFLKATTQSWDNNRIRETGFYFRAGDILAGRHDAFFIKAAQVCRNFGKPMFISWNHEMNGDWYTYSEAVATKQQNPLPSDWTAKKYIQFHRRVWRIFKDEGADNVAFAFAPVLIGRRLGRHDEAHSWRAYYPGDEYVDWLAPSFYNEVSAETFDVLAAATNKPIFASEWGSSATRVKWYNPKPYPGDGPWMARTMELWIQRYPNLKGSAYYQWEQGYAIQRSPEQLAEYRKALNDPVFIHGSTQGTAAD